MSSCQDGSDASGHFTSWMDYVNLDVETMGRAGLLELGLVGGEGHGLSCLCEACFIRLD